MVDHEFIPVNDIALSNEVKARAIEAINSDWISSAGPNISEFERAWARACGVKHGIAVSNGTVALELAAEILGLKDGDEVILPTQTIISCAQAITKVGAIPVTVDCRADNFCMDVSLLEAQITAKTKAIMVVHLFGHPVEMDEVFRLAAKHDLKVIEDAAEAHGAKYFSKFSNPEGEWLTCGSMGDVAIFSFFANKLINTGEGGMIVTNNDYLAEQARYRANLCFKKDRRFRHDDIGHQFRLTNVQAGLGVQQVAELDEIIATKVAIAEKYTSALKPLENLIQLPVTLTEWATNVHWVYPILLKSGAPFDATFFAKRLHAENVDSRPFFWNIHEQPVLLEAGFFGNVTHPIAENAARRGLYLPSGLAITDMQINRVCEVVYQVLTEK